MINISGLDAVPPPLFFNKDIFPAAYSLRYNTHTKDDNYCKKMEQKQDT